MESNKVDDNDIAKMKESGKNLVSRIARNLSGLRETLNLVQVIGPIFHYKKDEMPEQFYLLRAEMMRTLIVKKASKGHETRKHSKFSASSAERWTECPGSVALCEGAPDRQTVYTREGTQAHEILEKFLLAKIARKEKPGEKTKAPREMVAYAREAAEFIYKTHRENLGSEIKVETRVVLDFIHPEMFGTYDGAVSVHFDTLHVFDFKYGQGKRVSPKKNLQMIFYGLGLAHKYRYNFKRVRLWIIQPRIKGYDAPEFWDISIAELKEYVAVFKKAVRRIETHPKEYKEGDWCFWCKGKSKCPLKKQKKDEQAKAIFSKV